MDAYYLLSMIGGLSLLGNLIKYHFHVSLIVPLKDIARIHLMTVLRLQKFVITLIIISYIVC